MDTISLLALLLSFSAGFSILNHHTFRLPVTIGVLVFSLLASLLIMILNPLIPAYDLQALPRSVLGAINLSTALLNGALSLLLFAGATQVDVGHLRAKLPREVIAAIECMLLSGKRVLVERAGRGLHALRGSNAKVSTAGSIINEIVA